MLDKIEDGAYYINRMGERVGPVLLQGNDLCGTTEEPRNWYASGRLAGRKTQMHETPEDLIMKDRRPSKVKTTIAIEPGMYNRVSVGKTIDNRINILVFDDMYSVHDLRNIANTINEIADILEKSE